MTDRAKYMTEKQRAAMGQQPRRHDLCRDATGVARPGKTRQDKARRAQS
jgi:hypothetical protein